MNREIIILQKSQKTFGIIILKSVIFQYYYLDAVVRFVGRGRIVSIENSYLHFYQFFIVTHSVYFF